VALLGRAARKWPFEGPSRGWAIGWLGRYRRLSRDFEHTVESSEAMVYLASIRRMLKLVTN